MRRCDHTEMVIAELALLINPPEANMMKQPKQTVDEAGNVTSADPGMAPPIPPPLDVGTDQHGVHHSIVVDGGSEKVNPYANVHDALRKAKEKKS